VLRAFAAPDEAGRPAAGRPGPGPEQRPVTGEGRDPEFWRR
jgi:hypothetical protein